jgi:hypothetical protein
VKLATFVSRPPVKLATLYGTGQPLWYTWSLLHTVTTFVSWILAIVSHLVLCSVYKFKFCMFTEIRSCIVYVSTVHGPKYSFVSITTCCPFTLHHFSTSRNSSRLEFSSGNRPITVLQVRLHCQCYVRTCFATGPPAFALWTVLCTSHGEHFDFYSVSS